MSETARAAGVGVGTRYRHFPTRDELTIEVYQGELDRITDIVREETGELNALGALRAWTAAFASFVITTRGMMDRLRAAWRSPTPGTTPGTATIGKIIDGVLADGRADGSIRADGDTTDTTVAIIALVGASVPDGSEAQILRLLDLFVDALAAPATTGRAAPASSAAAPSTGDSPTTHPH